MVVTDINLKRSIRLLALLITICVLAGLSIALSHISVLIQISLAVSLLVTVIYAIWSTGKPLPSLRIKPDGQLQISIADGEWQSTELMPGSYVSPGLSVVRLRTQHNTHRLVLMRDSATPDALRRLRLSLRWAPRIRSDTAFPGAG